MELFSQPSTLNHQPTCEWALAKRLPLCYLNRIMNALERITVNPAVMSGKPCIRGLRVTVANVLRLLAAGHTPQRILAAYPYLEPADIEACLRTPPQIPA
jgi:uncharacterized protein (DUF433 family)